MKDLEERMKNNYEHRFRTYLPRRTNVIIRLDGKAFHTFTRGCEKPFDKNIITSFDYTAIELLNNVQNCKLAYTQSDEISLLLTDYDNLETEAWFDNNIQKMVSVSASLATARFNEVYPSSKTALFDSRVFVIPEKEEVANYFLWRHKDCARNSISMIAQSLFSHKELHGISIKEQIEMILEEVELGNLIEGWSNRELLGGLIDKNGSLEVKTHFSDFRETILNVFKEEKENEVE